jgi:hypothetical protein
MAEQLDTHCTPDGFPGPDSETALQVLRGADDKASSRVEQAMTLEDLSAWQREFNRQYKTPTID